MVLPFQFRYKYKAKKRLRLRTWIALGTIAVFLPIVLFLAYKAKTSQAAWYNAAWGYRQTITITNNGSQANYQVMVPVDTYTLSNAGKLQSDCDDLQFTTSDGTTTIPYWEEYCVNASGGGNSVVWVNYTSLPTGSTTIYMYYGNASASDQTTTPSTFPTEGAQINVGSGKDGAYSVSADTNINTADSGTRACSDTTGGDAVIYTSTTTANSGQANITLVETPTNPDCLAVGAPRRLVRGSPFFPSWSPLLPSRVHFRHSTRAGKYGVPRTARKMHLSEAKRHAPWSNSLPAISFAAWKSKRFEVPHGFAGRRCRR